MTKIRMLQDTLVEGEHCEAGQTVDVADAVARFLVAIRKAAKVVDSETIESAVLPDESEKAIQKRKRKTED